MEDKHDFYFEELKRHLWHLEQRFIDLKNRTNNIGYLVLVTLFILLAFVIFK